MKFDTLDIINQETQKLGAIATEKMSTAMREWLAHKSKGTIVLVYDPQEKIFVTYAWQAALMAQALDLQAAKEREISKLCVIPNHVWCDKDRLEKRFGASVVVIVNNAQHKAE